jgi:hypothetical protein
VVRPEVWWEFQPRQRVMTREGIAGTVDDVVDGPGPGNETYLVTLDAGLGGGEYGASELAPLSGATATVGRTAESDYPELGTVLLDRLPPAAIVPVAKVAGRLEQITAELLAEAGAAEDPCRCCAGAGEHDNGHECIRCDASGRAEGAEIQEPIPCAGKTAGSISPTCPCGTPARFDPDNGWQHSDTSYSHDGEFRGSTVSDLMAQAGWVRDLFRPPTAEHSYDWCRFRRDSHCWYPKGLDGAATRRVGYAVWTPTDRGRCPRGSWALQEQCPLGAPGPNAGGYTDATSAETQLGGVAAGLRDEGALSILRVMHPAELTVHQAAALRPDQIIESRPIPGGWDDEEEHRVSCPEHGPGQHWTGEWLNAMSWAARHLSLEHAEDRTAAAHEDTGRYITAAEARGNSRPVSRQEFDQISTRGRTLLDQMRKRRAPTAGLDAHWGDVKTHSWNETRKSWGGGTYDAHTGQPLASDADRYALSVKPPGARPVSVHEKAPREEFERAMEHARRRFRPLLENDRHYLGVFHDDEHSRVDIDPVVVVNSPAEVEAIGAHTHSIGGAYHFRSGDGYFPPHVAEQERQKEAMLSEQVTWKGPGHWRSNAEATQPGFVHPDDPEMDLGAEASTARQAAHSEQRDQPYPKNYRVEYTHPANEQRANDVSGRESFASADTAIGLARRIFDAGASVVHVTRRHDGKVVYDPHAGIEADYRDW